jgi:glycosyltransferase involved in cell wall biosynthesis
MKKVLVITYYWPPAGGIAVNRITKFCKYLSEFGWEPVVLTVKKGNYVSTDNTLLQDIKHITDVYRTPSLEPHTVYKLLSSWFARSHKQNSNSISKPRLPKFKAFAELIRLNIFVPDSRIGWKPFATREGKRIIDTTKPDLIFSTAPPFTPHLVAMELHKSSGIPWVADFRDPWVDAACYNTVKRLTLIKNINRNLEKNVVKTATALTFTGPQLRDHYLMQSGEEFRKKAHVITNGYDPEDLTHPTQAQSSRFYISYFGSIYIRRYKHVLFQTIQKLLNENASLAKDLCLRIVGNIDEEIKTSLQQLIPAANLEITGFIPYADTVALLQQPQLLLLIVDRVDYNENITLGKVFDYLPTGNPVLGVGPVNGDTANIIHSTNAGKVADYCDQHSIEEYILEKYSAWKTNALRNAALDLTNYQREHLTEALARVFDQTLNTDKENN